MLGLFLGSLVPDWVSSHSKNKRKIPGKKKKKKEGLGEMLFIVRILYSRSENRGINWDPIGVSQENWPWLQPGDWLHSAHRGDGCRDSIGR